MLNIFCFILVILCFILYYYAGYPAQFYQFNSDGLYLAGLFRDILTKGGSISDWYLPPDAPYFFPDYLIYFIAWISASKAHTHLLIYSVLQFCLTCCSIWVLARVTSKQARLVQATIITSILIWLSVSSINFFWHITFPLYHFSIIIIIPFFIGSWIHYINCQKTYCKIGTGLLLCAVSLLTTLSDKLFLSQILAPLIATVLIFSIIEKKVAIRQVVMIACLLFMACLGYVLHSMIISSARPLDISVTDSILRLQNLCTIIFETINQSALSVTTFVIVIVSCIGFLFAIFRSLYRLLRQSHMEQYEKQRIFFVFFSFLSICSSVCAIAFIAGVPFVSNRHVLNIFYLPVIVTGIYYLPLLKTHSWTIGNLLMLIITGLFGLQTFRYIASGNTHSGGNAYMGEQNCIDAALKEAEVYRGIGPYWNVRPTEHFSELDLDIAQFNLQLQAHHWLTSKRFFTDYYDFALYLTSDLQTDGNDHIQRINGKPSKEVICGPLTLLIYGKNKLRINKFIEAGNSFEWKACELPLIAGKKLDNCIVALDNSSTDYQLLSFGPYELLPPGKYQIEFFYSSPNSSDEKAGGWDISPSGNGILAHGDLSGSNGLLTSAIGHFTVPENNTLPLEFRPGVHANKSVFLRSIKITMEQKF